MSGKRDTSPFIRSQRIKRLVRIQEINNPPSFVFDQTVDYPSDALPEWFEGLQSIVEDETFTSMTINIRSGKVQYQISIVGEMSEVEPDEIPEE